MRASLTFVIFAGLAAAAPSLGQKKRDSDKSFTLSVADKSDSTRDYARDWAAAHQKWGKGVPSSAVSAFSLIDDGKSEFLCPPPVDVPS